MMCQMCRALMADSSGGARGDCGARCSGERGCWTVIGRSDLLGGEVVEYT